MRFCARGVLPGPKSHKWIWILKTNSKISTWSLGGSNLANNYSEQLFCVLDVIFKELVKLLDSLVMVLLEDVLNAIQRETGAHYTLLPYFDPARMCITDSIHNLFLLWKVLPNVLFHQLICDGYQQKLNWIFWIYGGTMERLDTTILLFPSKMYYHVYITNVGFYLFNASWISNNVHLWNGL